MVQPGDRTALLLLALPPRLRRRPARVRLPGDHHLRRRHALRGRRDLLPARGAVAYHQGGTHAPRRPAGARQPGRAARPDGLPGHPPPLRQPQPLSRTPTS
ncbi:hypothetical protein SBRY_10908 [Actinacidiphila bryophytorum]|uniref:Uncharacterized protein n=1 Tax=Actinacidiphila bryophytorum TaxID=1436133 RepID=A0A9W4GWG7_9ACTN|nr:hypothetical protein SBRY_10908 [Actinacidiphila bryophytorum]